MVVDALRTVAAALAGVDDKDRVGLVQAVFPRHIGGQHDDAVLHAGVSAADRVVGAVHGVGGGDLVLKDLLCHGHGTPEAHVGVILRVPQRVETADGVGQRVLLAGVVVQIQRLDEVFVQQAGLMLAHELCAEQPPQQAERGVGHAVGAALPRLGVVVEHTAADVVDDAVEVIRHNEAPRHLNVRAQDL